MAWISRDFHRILELVQENGHAREAPQSRNRMQRMLLLSFFIKSNAFIATPVLRSTLIKSSTDN
jgi:hypothetical protein